MRTGCICIAVVGRSWNVSREHVHGAEVRLDLAEHRVHLRGVRQVAGERDVLAADDLTRVLQAHLSAQGTPLAAIAAWGVTPQAQKTGSHPSGISTASP